MNDGFCATSSPLWHVTWWCYVNGQPAQRGVYGLPAQSIKEALERAQRLHAPRNAWGFHVHPRRDYGVASLNA